MNYLVCLLEEPSAKEMLKAILKRILPEEISVKYIVFEGKQDLEKNLKLRLKRWLIPNSLFLVMRDQDSGDCVIIKNNLKQKVLDSSKNEFTIIRVACHELETFYLGDLAAVENGLNITGLAQKQNKGKYRNPDRLSNAKEELIKLTKNEYTDGIFILRLHVAVTNLLVNVYFTF